MFDLLKQNDRKKLKQREKIDAAAFAVAKKKLVFYALTGGQYKYYKMIIEYLLKNCEIVIHYLTNDPNDALFEQNNPKLIPYYVSERKTISLMLRLDADIVVTTVPDLQSYHMKRSTRRDDIEYIYVFHAPISTTMQYKEKAFDHFDTVFCVGPHHVAELRRREEIAGLPKRNLVKAGYGLYDELGNSYNSADTRSRTKPQILIAPSWQRDNIFETCIEDILDTILGKGNIVTVRPHPQFMRLCADKMEALERQYEKFVKAGELIFETDFSGNTSIYMSDLLITDWSGIAYEFSYATSKPCVFINTPQKIMNPNYLKYDIEPMELTVRNKIGKSIDPFDIKEKLAPAVEALLQGDGADSQQIKEILKQYVFYPGRSGEAGGRYIIEKAGV
ncbi:MAG: CDP-glycerol glycerophosphotransferase family protein [Oscillospiraceae bacterium]|nr:CDP-glycerol glycerophosphotransferase family protein [Oscillospiraceae bacterium]